MIPCMFFHCGGGGGNLDQLREGHSGFFLTQNVLSQDCYCIIDSLSHTTYVETKQKPSQIFQLSAAGWLARGRLEKDKKKTDRNLSLEQKIRISKQGTIVAKGLFHEDTNTDYQRVRKMS